MKRELERIASLFRTEFQVASFTVSAMRRNALIAGFFAIVLLAGRVIAEAHLSLSSLPILRGGHAAAFAPSGTITTKPLKEKLGHPIRILSALVSLQRNIDIVGSKIQTGAVRQWSDLQENVGREWDKLTTSIEKLFSNDDRQGKSNLDEVLRTFKSVLEGGNEVDTAKLLRACRAHLLLMKSGGAALRVVAKDMEANLAKAEALFRKLGKGKNGRNLASLLEIERESGVHEGSALKDHSAAMGLLWIRRSLAFQLDLYSSLVTPDGLHPRDAAMEAYHKTLSPYHGWLLQKAFPLSLSQMPDRRVFIAKFGGREVDELDEQYEKAIVKNLKTLVATWEPIINTWRQEFERLDLEDIRRV